MMRVSAYKINSSGVFQRVDEFDADDPNAGDATVASLSTARMGLQDVMVAARLVAGGSTMFSFNIDADE